jgi:DNA repair protein RecO (recombination protein O)
VDFSETSRIVTFLTARRGLITCIAKGVRRKNSPLAATLDTFNSVELVYYWKDSRSVQTLADASLIYGFPVLKCDLTSMALAAFVVELAQKAGRENNPSPLLYASLQAGLRAIESSDGAPWGAAAWCALRLLQAMGYAPAIADCALCGEVLTSGAGFSWRGGVVCSRCAADAPLTLEVYEVLLALNEAETPVLDIAADDAREVLRLLWRFAERHLESGFRSINVIRQVLA